MNAGAHSFLRLKILVCTLVAVSAYGQAISLQFCNGCLPSPPDRLVRDVNNIPLVGTSYVAQLYIGASPNNLTPTTATPSRFRAPGTGQEGTWTSTTINLTGFTPGQPIYMQVAVWDMSVAPTYSAAAASSTGQYGRSAAFIYNPCSTPPTANCDLMLGFLGFRLTSNPPDRTLVIQENGDRVDLLYAGMHTIQGAASLAGPWVTLTTASAPYTDPASGTNRQRFYRMLDEPGPTYSLNVVGYYRVDACAGFSMVANQFNTPGGNAVTNVLRSPAERTEIYKYSPAMGGYISLSYLGGAWEGDDLEMTLSPGEGAFLYSPVAQSLRFLGEVSLIRSVPIPSGFSIISAPQPRTGPLNQMNFPTAQGICLFQWTCGATGYRSNCYIAGAWEGDDAGNVPAVGLGESFWVLNPGAPITWNGIYCITCP